jgi:hypothetical protein
LSDSRIQVAIVQDTYGDGINLTVRIKDDHTHSRYMKITEEGRYIWEDMDGSLMRAHPTMHLSDDTGRAMLQALMNHYQGAEDLRTVRADLIHERGRVDKLINMYGDLAEKAIAEA